MSVLVQKSVDLIVPNLARLGVPRRGDGISADLETIWLSPYPVITNYLAACKDLEAEPFAGGTREKQGQPYAPGYITSGYRDKLVDNNESSPHLHALAIDIVAGSIEDQIRFAQAFDRHFVRVGLYPARKFIHVDLAPANWMLHYGKAYYWVETQEAGKVANKPFHSLAEASHFARAIA